MITYEVRFGEEVVPFGERGRSARGYASRVSKMFSDHIVHVVALGDDGEEVGRSMYSRGLCLSVEGGV